MEIILDQWISKDHEEVQINDELISNYRMSTIQNKD